MSDTDSSSPAAAAKADMPEAAAETDQPRADERVAEPAPKPAPQPRSGGLMVLGGALAAVFGFGLAQIVPNGWPMSDTSALATAQADLAQRLSAAEAALAAGEVRVGDLSTAVAGLTQDVANIPAPPVPPDLAPLQDRLAALEAQVQGIAALPAGDGPANAALAAQIAALQAEVQRLAAAPPPSAAPSADVTAALNDAEAAATALRRAAAADRVAAALQTGAPYADALSPLGDDLPEALTAPAASGVETDAALLAAFPDAARASLAALAAEQAQAGGWTDRALAFLQMQTGARSVTARDGDSADAVLSRAEAALKAGRLADAVAEVAALPPTAAGPMADWLTQAQVTLAARAALATLQQGG